MLILCVDLAIWTLIRIVLVYVDANEILNVFNSCPNSQINIDNQHLGKCRVRYYFRLVGVSNIPERERERERERARACGGAICRAIW